jgi:hypothetical protein
MRTLSTLLALGLALPALAQEPDQVTLELKEFLKLYETAKNRPKAPEQAPRAHALAAAKYKAEVVLEDGDPVSAVFKAAMNVDVMKDKGWVKIPLLPATVAVQSATISGKQAPLVLEGGYYMLYTDQKGAFRVDIEFAVGVDTSQGSSGFSFQLVPSGATELELSVPVSEELDFKVANARFQSDRTVGKKQILNATLPSTGALSVHWQREIPEGTEEGQEEEPRIYAEVYTLVNVGDGILHAKATVQDTILFAGVNEFQAKIPSDMTLLDVTGNGIRDWALDDDGLLTVSLNYAAEGSYRWAVEMERVLDDASSLTEGTPLIEPVGVERFKGWVGVQASGTLELASGEVSDATPVDVRTLPAAIIGVTNQPVLLGYKYIGGEATIPIEVYKHAEVDVLVTLLDQANATTMFTAEGRRLTSVTYDVRNNRRQFLKLALPEGAELWSASVAGQSVQPAQGGDGKILLPLLRSQAAGGALASFPVQVVYVATGEAPNERGAGHFEAALPQVDVPTTYVAWTVYAPWEAKIDRKSFDGSVRGVDALSRPLAATEVLAMDRQQRAVSRSAGKQIASGGLGQGAAPVKVNLPLEGQALAFEKLLALDERLWTSFDYKGLK